MLCKTELLTLDSSNCKISLYTSTIVVSLPKSVPSHFTAHFICTFHFLRDCYMHGSFNQFI
jgi:hypothetical protein